jgi:hypothetical protein
LIALPLPCNDGRAQRGRNTAQLRDHLQPVSTWQRRKLASRSTNRGSRGGRAAPHGCQDVSHPRAAMRRGCRRPRKAGQRIGARLRQEAAGRALRVLARAPSGERLEAGRWAGLCGSVG